MKYYLLLLAAFLVRKIVDQLRSRRHARALALHGAVRQPDRGLIGFWLAHLVFFIVVPLELCLRRPPFVPALGIPMLTLFVSAFLLRWWSTHLLAANWTSHIVMSSDFQPVTHGPYRLIRHPNYLAMTVELVALAMVYPTFMSAAIVATLTIPAVLARIHREEEVLFEIPTYRTAMEHKARLVPGIY
jgi:methyltransferase